MGKGQVVSNLGGPFTGSGQGQGVGVSGEVRKLEAWATRQTKAERRKLPPVKFSRSA